MNSYQLIYGLFSLLVCVIIVYIRYKTIEKNNTHDNNTIIIIKKLELKKESKLLK